MALYPNLPGIEVSIADGGLILPEDATTESLLIIAPSLEDSAPQEPVLVRQSSDITGSGFGPFVKSGVVNPIAAAWKAAFEGGCRRIYLMALPGSNDEQRFLFLQDRFFGILADFSVDHVALVGVFADVEAQLSVLPLNTEGVKQGYYQEGSTLTFPLTVTTADNTIVFDGAEPLDLGETAGIHSISVDARVYASAGDLVEEISTKLAATELGITAEVVNNKVVLSRATAFATINGTDAFGLPVANAGGGISGNFALLAGQYAENQTLNHSSTIAYIGTTAPTANNLTAIKTKVDALSGMNNQYSGYVSVVASPELGYILPGKSDMYFTNGVVTYAALVTTLRPESATTNKRVYGVAGINYNLSLRQLNALSGNKFVTFRLKGNQIVVTDGCTTAPDYYLGGTKQASDFARLSTLRITQAAAQLIRDLTEPYIGEPNRMPQYNALNATVKAGLESMKNEGAIFDYRFTIVAAGGTLSEAVITLELVPAFELRKVSVNVSLKPPYTM